VCLTMANERRSVKVSKRCLEASAAVNRVRRQRVSVLTILQRSSPSPTKRIENILFARAQRDSLRWTAVSPIVMDVSSPNA
jgi:hypothetical protein